MAGNKETPTFSTYGHVFVLHCGTDGIAADALLLQSEDVPQDGVSVKKKDDDFHDFCVYEADLNGLNAPESGTEACVSVASSFLEQAAQHLQGKQSVYRRSKPLIAMSIPGVGAPCQPDRDIRPQYAIIQQVIPKAYEVASKYGIDIALCICETDAYDLVQLVRERLCPFEAGPFWMLTDEQLSEIARLQTAADRNQLSVFIGAGVAIPSGLPTWGGLLEMVAKKAGFTEDEIKDLKELTFLDQPTLIEEKMGSAFKDAVAECVMEGRFTPAHALLKALDVPAVTTNYDNIFESSARSCGEEIPKLPWQANQIVAGEKCTRSILKLHGCCELPSSIILTRKDYMRYPDKNQALRGRVQGLFLSSEMLFVGFSMTDDNMHVIIDQVRKVLYTPDGKPTKKLGTILQLRENTMFRKLWTPDFNILSFGKSWKHQPDWHLDCFLDCLVAGRRVRHARAHLSLDPNFEDLHLSNNESDVKQALEPLARLLRDKEDSDISESESLSKISKLLEDLGMPRR